jgi:hypothetical protein
VLLAILSGLFTSGCNPPARGSAPAQGAASIRFTEVSDAAGVVFTHFTGARGKKYLPETIGSGLAFLDYDGDGWQDLLLMNGAAWPGDPNPHPTPHLYHNRGNGTFEDVTPGSGLDRELYGMGAAVGDFDNDGDPDLYLTAVGPNRLLRNTRGAAPGAGAPIFEDVTRSAGVAGAGPDLRWKWSTSAVWLDYDRDGKLDLYVPNYVKWSPATDLFCGSPAGVKGYCPPDSYVGVPPTLYHNEGGGRFRDVSRSMGLPTSGTGKSFGVAVGDYNADGWPDLAVANDTWPNFLFLNEMGRRFTERGGASGLGWTEGAKTKAGMGIDAADWKNDGRFGLLVGNFSQESLSLFENDGAALFRDRASESGLGSTSLLFLTFGAFFCDFDLDGWLDAFTANGHINDLLDPRTSPVAYRERPLLYRNLADGRFEEVAVSAGLTEPLVGRGAAWADWDNDGDADVAVLCGGGRARLYRNDAPPGRHWMRFRPVGRRSNRDGLGALVRVTTGAQTQSRYVKSGGSFLSESQRAPLFGLGPAARVDGVTVTWPSGAVTRSGPLDADRTYLLDERSGIAPAPSGTEPPPGVGAPPETKTGY